MRLAREKERSNMEKIRLGVYLPQESKGFFEELGGKTARGVTFALESFQLAYQKSLVELKGYFAPEELCLIVELMDVTKLTGGSSGSQITRRANHELDFKEGAWKKRYPELDFTDFRAALEEMSFFRRVSIEIWAKGFYGQAEKDLVHYVESLSKQPS